MSIWNRFKEIRLLKSFSVYFFSTILNQAVSFLLLPVFTFYLTPYDYGVLALANTGISIFSILVMVGADGAIRRQFYKVEGNEYSAFLSSAFFTTIGAFLLISLLTLITSQWLEPLTHIPRKWLLLSPLIGLAAALPSILLGQFRVKQQPTSFAVLSNLMTLANLGLGIWLVVGVRMGYEGRLYSILAVNVLFFLIAFIILRRQQLLEYKLQWNSVRASLRYGLPIIPHQLGSLVIAFADRFFIAKMISIDQAGIYNIGYTIGSIISVIEGTFNYAFIPFLFENLKKNTEADKLKIVKTSYLFILALLICVVLLYATSDFIFSNFIDGKFSGGRVYVIWIAIGYFFSGCYKMVAGYIYYSGKTIYLTYLAFINVFLSILFNYFFIKNWGTIGAAWSTMCSFFIMFLLTAYIGNRLVPMPWFGLKKVYK